MPTELVLKSLDIYAKIFQRFQPLPVQWDTTRKEFNYVSNRWSLLTWYCGLTLLGTYGMGTYSFVLLREFLLPTITMPLLKIMIMGVLLILVIFVLCLSKALSKFGEDFIFGWNQMQILESRIFEFQIKKNIWHKKHADVDIMGVVLIAVVIMSVIWPVVGIPGGLLLKLDPYDFIIQHIPQLSIDDRHFIFILIVFFFRIILILWMVLQFCKLFPLTVILFVTGLQMIIRILNVIKKESNASLSTDIFISKLTTSRKLQRLIDMHVLQMVLWTIWRRFQECGTCFLMALGMLMSVFCCSGTIRAYHLLPFLVYQVVPTAFAVTIGIIQSTIPLTIQINETTKILLRKWKIASSLQVRDRAFLYRKIQCQQPLTLYVGIGGLNFFRLKKSTRTTYLWGVATYVANLNLAVPQRFIEKAFQLMKVSFYELFL